MDLNIPRSFIGYRRRATGALFEMLTEEIATARAQRAVEGAALSGRLDEALAALRIAEGQIAAEQEEQKVLLATMDAYAARGTEMVENVRRQLAEREAELLAKVARREALLGKRRALSRTLRDSVAEAVRQAMEEIDRLPGEAPDARISEAGVVEAAAVDEPARQRRLEIGG